MFIKLAIVEDDNEIRASLQSIISSSQDFKCVGTFANAEDFIKQFDALSIDVVIMDIHLPGKSGIQCVELLKKKNPSVQFLMCTIFEDDETIFNSLCAGASGYILKNTPPDKLFEAIKSIHNGGSPMSGNIARKVVSSFQKNTSTIEQHNLTLREKEIADLLAKGYRYKEIAAKLFVSIETVRTHIRNIYEKLQVNSRTEALNKVFPK